MTKNRRIFRRSIDVICVVCILLLAGLWTRGENQIDLILVMINPAMNDSECYIISHSGRLTVGWYYFSLIKWADYEEKWYWSKDWCTMMIGSQRNMHASQDVLLFDSAWTTKSKYIHFPLWLPMLLLSIAPLWHLLTYIRQRRHIPAGHVLCANCGYDLFGTEGATCPECGAAKGGGGIQ